VAIVQDAVYVDGGLLYWRRGMADGSAVVSGDGESAADIFFWLALFIFFSLSRTCSRLTPPQGPSGATYMRKLALSTPFSTSSNLTSLFAPLPKAQGAGNDAPTYVNGALLANNHEFFLYGGLMALSALAEPFAEEILGYRVGQYGPARDAFSPGPVGVHLPAGVTRYVAYGAAASAPAENLAWYVGGMTAPDRGPVYQAVAEGDSRNAVRPADSFVIVDLAHQLRETWENRTLPEGVDRQASAEAVWLPVGKRGMLVLVGGSTNPEYLYAVRPEDLRLEDAVRESPL
jgi:hypothetical protein